MKINAVKPNGFNLIESILVLALIAIISCGAYFIYYKIMDFYLLQREVNHMKQIMVDSKLYIKNSNKLFLSPALFAELSIIHSDEITTDPHPYYINSFSSKSDFSPIFSGPNNQITHLKVTYLTMTGQFCARLISKLEPDADFISIGNEVLKNKYDINNNVDYVQEKTISSCAKIDIAQTDFPMIISLRY